MDEYSIADLGRLMAGGDASAQEVCQAYLDRVAALDQAGPHLNAVIALNPDALKTAADRDRDREAGRVRGPLHGVPILIKDNIDTLDMPTTAGSLALEGVTPPRDAFLVARLRAAGAVILGKTNLSEWANFRSSFSSSGLSSVGGQTRNPYVLDRNPCGSSSGSGVAVAANLCAAAVGTETDGSITCPASVNGIVGLKPTVGLVSRRGIIPISASQDTAGPMARSVQDAATLLSALVGVDPEDAATAAGAGWALEDYTTNLGPNGLRRVRLGVVRDLSGYHPEVDRVLEDAISTLRDLEAEVIDDLRLELPTALKAAEVEVLLYEFHTGLDRYLAGLENPPVRSLAEVVAFNRRHHERVLGPFDQKRLEGALAKGPLSEAAYREALETCRRLSRDEGIDRLLKTHRLDALIAPSNGPAWTTDPLNGDRYLGSSSTPAAVAGYPNLSVPAGFVGELPVGLSFFATAYREAALLRYAYAFEMATRIRRAPQFIPSLGT